MTKPLQPWTVIRNVRLGEEAYNKEGERIVGIVAAHEIMGDLEAAGFKIARVRKTKRKPFTFEGDGANGETAMGGKE